MLDLQVHFLLLKGQKVMEGKAKHVLQCALFGRLFSGVSCIWHCVYDSYITMNYVLTQYGQLLAVIIVLHVQR